MFNHKPKYVNNWFDHYIVIALILISTLISIIISVKSTDGLITDLHQWKRNIATGILIANEKA